ncbi:MAG: aldehyde ferredoxin oxidoreductase family protein, partial [Candidatus Nezhaarchaeales archaeon]
YTRTFKGMDPLSPQNPIIVATGPLTASTAPTFGAKSVFACKSPLTGIYLDSFVGGFFGARLKSAGIDYLVITGRSDKPCYVWVHEEGVEIRDATDIWGKTSSETDAMIKKDVGDEANTSVAKIGPAGERLVRFSCITVDSGRQAARGGVGAVFGSKNLKAIAATSKIKIPEPADKSKYDDAVNTIIEIIKKHPVTGQVLPAVGTPSLVDVANGHGILPTRNWDEGFFEGAEKINADSLKKYVIASRACYGCIIGCIKHTEIKEGKYANTKLEGPEYESIGALGANCCIDDIEAVIYANKLCDEYGMDTITAGNVVAFAMECYEKGIIKPSDTGGLELKFGSPEALIGLIEMIARRDKIGDVLANGVREAAKTLKAEDIAVHVKGLEPPAWDPRGSWGQALTYAVSDRGACHLSAAVLPMEIFGIPKLIDRFTIEGKAGYVKETEDFIAAHETLVGCEFGRFPLSPEHPAKLLSAMTGLDFDTEKFLKLGERIINLTRMFNVREGITRKDDTIPRKITAKPHSKGASAGKIITQEMLDKMLDEYYRLRAWSQNGIPTEEKLRELNLTFTLTT